MDTCNSRHYDFIDLLKGFGIFLVVWGHTMVPRSILIYAFHMPLFFFISGFLYKNKPWKEFLISKLNRLYLPYAIFSVVSWAFYLAMLIFKKRSDLISDHLPKILSLFTGTGRNGGNDPIWFLTCLLVVSLLFWCLNNLFKKPSWMFLAALPMSGLGYFLGIRQIALPFKIDVALIALVFYFWGYYFRQQNLLEQSKQLKRPFIIMLLVVCLGLYLYLAHLNIRLTGIPKVSMISNRLGNYFLFYLTAYCAIIVLAVIGYRIGSIHGLNFLGHHSLVVLAAHKPLLYVIKCFLEPLIDTHSKIYEILSTIVVIFAITLCVYLWNKNWLRWTRSRQSTGNFNFLKR